MMQVKAISNITISAFMFALAGMLVKYISYKMDVLSLVFWRNVFSFIIVSFIGLVSGKLSFKSERKGLHALRSFFTFCALITYFYAVKNTELSTAVLLQQTSPIFVPVIALLVLRRLSDRYVWIGTIIGFIGVAMTSGVATHSINGGDLSGILSGVMGAAATITIWMMSDTETPYSQMFFFSLYTLIYSLVFVPWVWESFSLSLLPLLIMLGIVTTLAQYFLSAACSYASTDKIVSWTYLSVIFSALFGYVGWGEKLSFSMLSGMALIIIGAKITLRRN
ncbi:DMT family transporter [Pantoea sp. Taur]|uniref:DMT family transporter n=1 Tax=Pantoea sp. Taur TaxID=2576757 RepID=UPI001356168B|nr:DMT family transporter [Pantoea sp. Taur]MXP56905.1 DMT family transporter [Pantoea sp. Taur]